MSKRLLTRSAGPNTRRPCERSCHTHRAAHLNQCQLDSAAFSIRNQQFHSQKLCPIFLSYCSSLQSVTCSGSHSSEASLQHRTAHCWHRLFAQHSKSHNTSALWPSSFCIICAAAVKHSTHSNNFWPGPLYCPVSQSWLSSIYSSPSLQLSQ